MASKELEKLIKQTVQKAQEEGIKITELNNLITDCRYEVGFVRQEAKKSEYRKATKKEEKFRNSVYEFLLKEVSLEEATSEDYKKYGHIISEKAFEMNMNFIADIIYAARILKNDGEKITNKNIMEVLCSKKYKNNGTILSKIGYRIKEMKSIFYAKRENKTWKFYSCGSYFDRTDKFIKACFELLEDNGIK